MYELHTINYLILKVPRTSHDYEAFFLAQNFISYVRKQIQMVMKKLILMGTLSLLLTGVYAQETSDRDTAQNPVRQGDPAVRQTPEEIQDNGLRDMVKISETEIPASMQNALKGSDYNGESKTFYKSKNGDSYAVEIKDGNITQTYRFDKQGKPVNDKRD